MYKDNMWGLLGLYQCLNEIAHPEVSLVSKNEESKTSCLQVYTRQGKSFHVHFTSTNIILFCIDQL